jgi:hypothetical protein
LCIFLTLFSCACGAFSASTTCGISCTGTTTTGCSRTALSVLSATISLNVTPCGT